MEPISTITVMLLSAGLLIIGFLAGWLINSKITYSKMTKAEESAEKIVKDALLEAEALKKTAMLEAKDEMYKEQLRIEREMETRREELQKTESKLVTRERQLDRKVDLLNNKERSITAKERQFAVRDKALQARDEQLSAVIIEQNAKLERIAGMSQEEAKALLMANMEEEARKDAVWRAREIREEAIAKADREAKEIITRAVQRLATKHVGESTVSIVNLPSDEMKGRIIGREGRNIRAFETSTGVDVVVDDTPQAVILSGFDPIRREVARMALEHLILDGRIHPGRIEEVVEKTRHDMEEVIREAGEQAAFDAGVHGLHERLVEMLGRLKFKTSYGQNLLMHSGEVAFLAGMMAEHLGLDAALARRAGLLHDIGKAATHEVEGTPEEIGAEMARKFGEVPVVVNALEPHPDGAEIISPIVSLVEAADTMSSRRPGAQRDTLEGFIKRMEKLEATASAFNGVQNAYAIQAGREIRVIVDSDLVSDSDTDRLASEISEKIEQEMEFPGQVKVSVIREMRAVDYAMREIKPGAGTGPLQTPVGNHRR
ncbi:MAG: ribonuclease Y [Candidatus Latescibacteria bacterium]|nr:ribonuclease Y [Candidatus Latescibacterota bacterium]